MSVPTTVPPHGESTGGHDAALDLGARRCGGVGRRRVQRQRRRRQAPTTTSPTGTTDASTATDHRDARDDRAARSDRAARDDHDRAPGDAGRRGDDRRDRASAHRRRRRRLRPARHPPVPAAVPERRLPRRRCDHGERLPGRTCPDGRCRPTLRVRRSTHPRGTSTTDSARTRRSSPTSPTSTPPNLPTWTDLAASLDDDATVVLVDTASGERVPLWAEPDAGAELPEDRLLVIHPAREPRAGDHLRGRPPRSRHDRRRADRRVARVPRVPRPPHHRPPRDRGPTRRDGGRRSTRWPRAASPVTTCSWRGRFTTASIENTTAGILKIRDETMAALGDFTPEFRSPRSATTPKRRASPDSWRAPTACRTT